MRKKHYWNFSCAKNNVKIDLIRRLLTEKNPVKTLLRSFFILTLTFGSAQAETIYVADDVNLSLRDAASMQGKVLKSLPTGTHLTVIGKQSKAEFIHVRLLDGTEGYIKSRYTKNQAPAVDPKDTASKTIALLQSDNAALRTELNALKDSLTPGSSLEKMMPRVFMASPQMQNSSRSRYFHFLRRVYALSKSMLTKDWNISYPFMMQAITALWL